MIETALENSVADEGTAARVTVNVAGVVVQTVAADASMRLEARGATALFRDEEAAPDVVIEASWDELDERAPGELVFDSGALWKLYSLEGDYVLRFVTPALGRVPYKVATFTRDFTRGSVRLHRPYFDTADALYPLDYPLDELLMLNLLARGRGAELHSCGVVDDTGAGFLFIGQSGAGKTTTARLWEKREGAAILSDDRIIVRRRDEEFRMYGTPWHGEGELSMAESAPLKRIFFLRHGATNELIPLTRAESAARLFSCSFPTFYDAEGVSFTLRFFDELTACVPCFELSFVPDESAVDFVRRLAD